MEETVKKGFALNEENTNQLALQLFDVGAVLCNDYYKLKLHEKHPEAPLSPFFMNLRTPDNPKPGPLTPAIVQKISEIFYDYAVFSSMIDDFDYIIGIPNAADPFVKAFAELMSDGKDRVLHLTKITGDSSRKIGPLTGESAAKAVPGKKVLLFDDLITGADSKFEAIKAVEDSGLVVKDVLVLIDREQGGADQIVKSGYMIHKIYKISSMLYFYKHMGKISAEKCAEIYQYLSLAT